MIGRVQNKSTLRAANIKNNAQRFHASTQSLPAPVGGWNARDSIADMKPDDAVILQNFFPQTSSVSARKGYTLHATTFTGQCESLMVYNSATAQQMMAAVGTVFYNATNSGAVGAAVQTGLTNARWQSTNFSTSAGSFMYCVNGVDKPRLYNGSTWVSIDSGSTPAISGVTTTSLINVNVFKRRIWFVEKNSLKAWYLPIDSIGGVAQMLDFRSIAGLGGYLVAMGTWTIDGGTGSDDYAVFVTSQGQVIVYRGIDPANEATWALAGVYNVGSPIGYRCMQKWGGDLLIMTYDGVFAMSSYLQGGRINTQVALSDKIRTAMSDAIAAYGANFGWEMVVYPKGNGLVVNIPVNTGSTQQQFVMNTISKAWCNFTDWSANCWALFDDDIYFGSDGFVGHGWHEFADNVSDISCLAAQAFNYFGSRGQEKRFTMMRPMIQTNGFPAVLANVNVDYNLDPPTTPASFAPNTSSFWDVAFWDSGLWGGYFTLRDWQAVNGLGYCAAPILQISTKGTDVSWLSSDLVLEPGGVI